MSAPDAGRLYIHESILISVEHRKAYVDHFTDVWGPASRELYGMHCFGVWATSGSTGPWPEAVVMWELEGVHHLSAMMSGEFEFLKQPVHTGGDHFERFWKSAPPGVVPTSGVDRLLVPSATSRPVAELVAAGIRGVGYVHETVSVTPGAAPDYLDLVEAELKPVVESLGPQMVGAWRTVLRGDAETVVLWALSSWATWEVFVRDLPTDRRLTRFRHLARSMGADASAKLVVGAARSPLEGGRLL